MTDELKKTRKTGRKTVWSPELGDNKRPYPGYPAPPAIQSLIREKPVKRLLNKLATNETFKAKVLKPFQDKPED
jgi:hypothetical protein